MNANATLDLLLRHRSIRSYTDDVVPDAHVRAAVEAGQAASTSSAVQAYSLLQITEPEVRAALVPLTGGQGKVAAAGAFFVVCGDVRRHRLICEAAGTQYDARLEAFLVAAVDASLFAQNLVVAFESMGYGACYIGGLRNDLAAVDALLGLPEGVYPLYGLCVGVPAEQPLPRPRLAPEAVWFKDRYPDEDVIRELLNTYDATYTEYMEARMGKARAWTPSMARKFATPARTSVGPYYRDKGADLE